MLEILYYYERFGPMNHLQHMLSLKHADINDAQLLRLIIKRIKSCSGSCREGRTRLGSLLQFSHPEVETHPDKHCRLDIRLADRLITQRLLARHEEAAESGYKGFEALVFF